jgi:spore germination protein GerM
MSYEKKMKDLMARLAAMSPEPPRYPEEIQMARPASRKTARPALAFAVAAVLVAILAVPLLLFTGEEGDPDVLATTTSTTAPVTSTTLPTTSTTVPETTTTVPTVETWNGVVFLYQVPEDSNLSNPALVPVALTIDGPFAEDVDFSRAISAALQTGAELPPGLQTAIPDDVIVHSTRVEGEIIIADMNEAFLDGAGGSLADFTMLNQLVYTLTVEQPDSKVLFTVGGEPVTAFGGNGIDLTEPLDRATYLDLEQLQLHVINLTSPIIEQDGRYLVEGIANVFEGALTVRVLDENEETVHEVPVQATSGSGTWGSFSTEIDAELVVPGESSIRVFTYSAEDGLPSDVVTIPILEDDVWRFTAGG